MTLDRDTLRERLQFYRELGVGPLYRREGFAPDPGIVEVAAEDTSEPLGTGAHDVAPVNLGDMDRESQLQVILDDIGPNCQRCKLAKQGRKQIVFGTGDP